VRLVSTGFRVFAKQNALFSVRKLSPDKQHYPQLMTAYLSTYSYLLISGLLEQLRVFQSCPTASELVFSELLCLFLKSAVIIMPHKGHSNYKVPFCCCYWTLGIVYVPEDTKYCMPYL